MSTLLPVVLGAALLQLNPGDPSGIEPGMISFRWHELKDTLGGFGYLNETSVQFYRVAQGQEPTTTEPYWMVRVVHEERLPGRSTRIDRWVDGRSCAAVGQALDALPRQPFEPYRPEDIREWGPRVQPHDSQAIFTTYGQVDGRQIETTFVDRQSGFVHQATLAARDLLLTCPETGPSAEPAATS